MTIQWTAYEEKAVNEEDDDEDEETEETVLEGIDPNDPIKVSRILIEFRLGKGDKTTTMHGFN